MDGQGPPQGFHPQGYGSLGGDMQGMPPQGMPPQGMPLEGMPPQGMLHQGMPPHGMPPQGMPPQGMPPQDMGQGFQQQQMQQQFEGPPGGLNLDENMDGMENGGQAAEHREEQDQEMEEEQPLPDPHPTVYVNNINEKIRGEKLRRGLRQVFAPFGKIRKISVRKGIKSHGQVGRTAVAIYMWCVCGCWLPPLYNANSDMIAPATLKPCQTPCVGFLLNIC